MIHYFLKQRLKFDLQMEEVEIIFWQRGPPKRSLNFKINRKLVKDIIQKFFAFSTMPPMQIFQFLFYFYFF